MKLNKHNTQSNIGGCERGYDNLGQSHSVHEFLINTNALPRHEALTVLEPCAEISSEETRRRGRVSNMNAAAEICREEKMMSGKKGRIHFPVHVELPKVTMSLFRS